MATACACPQENHSCALRDKQENCWSDTVPPLHLDYVSVKSLLEEWGGQPSRLEETLDFSPLCQGIFVFDSLFQIKTRPHRSGPSKHTGILPTFKLPECICLVGVGHPVYLHDNLWTKFWLHVTAWK